MNKLFSPFLLILFFMAPSLAAGEIKIGQKAPDFTLNALHGESVSLSGYTGKIVIIGFVDTCEPCMIQTQELEKLHAKYQGNPKVAVLGIVSEDKKETEKLLNATKPKARYPLLLDPKASVYKHYGLRGEPIVVIVDAKGNVSFKNFITYSEDLSVEVDKLLK